MNSLTNKMLLNVPPIITNCIHLPQKKKQTATGSAEEAPKLQTANR